MNSKYGSNVNSDKVVKMLVATLVAAVLAASPGIIPQAFAGNPHEVPSSGNPVSCAIVTTASSGGGTIDHINCTGDLNGLGGQGTAHAVITASGTLDLACINPSGGGDTYSHDTKPPGLRSTAAGVSGAQDV